MERWVGRIAVVTGASSGIGKAVAKELARQGLKVAALARRVDKLKELQDECKNYKGPLHYYKCDVSIDDEVANIMKLILKEMGPISVLVNNAGIFPPTPVTDTKQGSTRKLFETNLIGLVTCTQIVVEMMQEHNITDGHIININSIAGHTLLPSPSTVPYCASKHAITAISEGLRNELSALNSNIRVTSISPGLVKSDMADQLVEILKRPMPIISPQDIADCIVFTLSVRPNVNITEMTIQPVKETIASFQVMQ